MKKSILIVLLLVLLAVAVGASGCLSDNGGNGATNATPEVTFDESIVTLTVPGFELLAVRDSIASEQRILGVTDALNGITGYYWVTETSNNVYISVYQTENNASARAYVQSMINAHRAANNTVTNVTISGNNATVFTTTTFVGGANVERFTLAWASDDKLVIVFGPATWAEIKTIAEASDL